MTLERIHSEGLCAGRMVYALPFNSLMISHGGARGAGCWGASSLAMALPGEGGGPDRGGVCLASVLSFNRIFWFNPLGHRSLKTQLQHLRWTGSKGLSQEDKERSCARCRRALGLLLNRGTACQGCSHRVCSGCRVLLRRTGVWRCTVCYEDR